MASRGIPALARRKLVVTFIVLVALFLLYRYGRPRALRPSNERVSLDSQRFPAWPAWAVTPDPETQPRVRYNWARVPQSFPLKEPPKPLPRILPKGSIPKIQASTFPVKDAAAQLVQAERLAAVKGNFTHAWQGYRMYAWMKDEVAPISGGYHEGFGGWAASLVDALGTLWIMNMTKEFEEAVAAVDRIDFTVSSLEEIDLAESTVMYLGGLLSAYDLTKGRYPVLLEKAMQLGEMLYHAFDTPNRMPVARWNFKAPLTDKPLVADDTTPLADIGSLTLEFTRLSQITGESKYYDAVERVMDVFASQQNDTKLPGMWPVVVNAKLGDFRGHHEFTIGEMANSAYEYIPKQYLMLGGGVQRYKKLYEDAMKTIKQKIFYRPMTPDHRDILFAGRIKSNGETPVSELDTEPQVQQLGCYAGGMVGLAAKIFQIPDDIEIARKLVDGCLWAYETAKQGLMPEIFHTIPCKDPKNCPWSEDHWHSIVLRLQDDFESMEASKKRLPLGVIRVDDPRFTLRPEAIESIWYLYRITGDPRLQDRAWDIFTNITKHSTTHIAHAAIEDCTISDLQQHDNMESYWLAETLQYFYLIFSDPDLISLDEFVLNAKAHPLRRPS